MALTKGLATRKNIIEVATRHFFSYGFYNVTYEGIAREVGLTQPAIYKYFKNMDDLFLACCRHWDEKARETIYDNKDQIVSAKKQIKNYIYRHFNYTSKHRSHDSLVFGLYYYSMRSSDMMTYYRVLKSTAIANLEKIIQFGNLDGSWYVTDTAGIAETAHSLIAGEIFKFLIHPREETLSRRSIRVHKAFLKLLT